MEIINHKSLRGTQITGDKPRYYQDRQSNDFARDNVLFGDPQIIQFSFGEIERGLRWRDLVDRFIAR